MGMVSNRRVIKNLRNELDIISLSLNHDEQLGARSPSPPAHRKLLLRFQIEKRMMLSNLIGETNLENLLVIRHLLLNGKGVVEDHVS